MASKIGAKKLAKMALKLKTNKNVGSKTENLRYKNKNP